MSSSPPPFEAPPPPPPPQDSFSSVSEQESATQLPSSPDQSDKHYHDCEHIVSLPQSPTHRHNLVSKLKEVAKLSLSDPNYDPWSKYDMHKIPAERVRRHLFDPITHTWDTDETIVKVEKAPFDAGAMRQCFRLKKLSHCPYASSHYHAADWSRAQNYVAKSFKTASGDPDVSQEARDACFEDVKLQYEAARWADEFNAADPPKKIKVIRAYVIEFIDRENRPVMGLERFIPGKDENGVGYVKHNTNAGFVDRSLHRITPQTFSVHSFYKSFGTRMVVDIQGVGDLYTDPQVHSLDGRFGAADLGVRGFALFFVNYQHTSLASALGVPIFPLSRPELKRLASQEEAAAKAAADQERAPRNEYALAASISGWVQSIVRTISPPLGDAAAKTETSPPQERRTSMIARDAKLMKRLEAKKTFESLQRIVDGSDEEEEKEGDVALSKRGLAGNSLRDKPRSDSISDHLRHALKVASTGANFDYMNDPKLTQILDERQHVHTPMVPDDRLKSVLGMVHLDIAVLYGMSRFVEYNNGEICVESAFFHICHAASLGNVLATLALGRLLLGLSSSLCEGLLGHVDLDVDAGLDHLRRAAASEGTAAAAAAACLLVTHAKEEDERAAMAERVLNVIAVAREKEADANRIVFNVGETVEAAFEMGADYYKAEVRDVLEGDRYKVFYLEDEVEEELSGKYIKRLEGGGGDGEAAEKASAAPLASAPTGDAALALQEHDLQALLASIWKSRGDKDKASGYYAKAAASAMAAGKMGLANSFVALSEEE